MRTAISTGRTSISRAIGRTFLPITRCAASTSARTPSSLPITWAPTASCALYEWPAFAEFVQLALGEKHFYRYADPLADVIVNLAEAGGGFPWHFDTNNYTVILAIQNAEAGGEFQYSPNLRTPTDENYRGVQAVLDGDPTLVRTVNLRPGDLQIFRGRYSLHRVAPLFGNTVRYVAIFSFAERPDMVGSPERTRQLYGRLLPIHLDYAGRRADALID